MEIHMHLLVLVEPASYLGGGGHGAPTVAALAYHNANQPGTAGTMANHSFAKLG